MLDEPLGALDRHLRAELGREIRRIRDHEGVTLIYVTHDHDEAFAVADNILVLEQGHAVQHGAPEDVWLNPATPFVARFLGHANLFRCSVSAAVQTAEMEASCALGTWRVDATNAMANCTALNPTGGGFCWACRGGHDDRNSRRGYAARRKLRRLAGCRRMRR